MEEILDDLSLPEKIVPITTKETKKQGRPKKTEDIPTTNTTNENELVSCLRNERIIVRYINKSDGLWASTTNPRHVLSGGMAETSFKKYCVPRLASSGMYVNVLTDNEKAFLEEYMGLEYNALSIYKRQNNFWSDDNPEGINTVILGKRDNYLDLSIPEDYIKYKILLANKNFIAPSLQALEDHPKATYQYVIIEEGAEAKKLGKNVSITMECYKAFGKIEDDRHTMATVIELLSMRPVADDSSIEYLRGKINELIQANVKNFYKVITDSYLPTKVLIKRAVHAGLIYLKGDYYYIKEGNIPMCGNNEEPTFNIATKFLNQPRNQQIKLLLESKLSE